MDTALERVVAESQCYPYFLQLWDDALRHAANDAHTTDASELLRSLHEQLRAIDEIAKRCRVVSQGSHPTYFHVAVE